LCGDLS